jgi:protein-tyrosine phosphatase
MTQTRSVAVCTECDVHWFVDGESAKCAVPGHRHQQFEVHRHRSVVALPGGTTVVAASFDADDPYSRDRPPDYGLYFARRWQPPWPHDHVDWPDFGVPDDPAAMRASLGSVIERAQSGQRVEVGCLGGHGRTGTALACLAVLGGYPADRAVDWVWANYCRAAVETPRQEAFVAAFPS